MHVYIKWMFVARSPSLQLFCTPAPTSDALCDFAGWVLLANSVCCLAGLRRCDLAQQFLSKSSLKITWSVLSMAGVFAQRAFADQVV